MKRYFSFNVAAIKALFLSVVDYSQKGFEKSIILSQLCNAEGNNVIELLALLSGIIFLTELAILMELVFLP